MRIAGAALLLAPAIVSTGCTPSRAGVSATEAARALAGRILEKSMDVTDATLVGRFILEEDRGSRRGSLRIRYVSPDLYRVDAFESGAPGAGGATSFLVEGDSLLVYASPDSGPERSVLERESVLPLLEDFELQLEDLKALAVPAPYLDSVDLGRAEASRVRGGYLLKGPGPHGNTFSIWIDTKKEAVTKGRREERRGLPVVETKLSRFRRDEGVWRPSRVEVRHFGRDASISVQYERMSINDGLTRDDLLLRGMAR